MATKEVYSGEPAGFVNSAVVMPGKLLYLLTNLHKENAKAHHGVCISSLAAIGNLWSQMLKRCFIKRLYAFSYL